MVSWAVKYVGIFVKFLYIFYENILLRGRGGRGGEMKGKEGEGKGGEWGICFYQKCVCEYLKITSYILRIDFFRDRFSDVCLPI